MAQLMKIGKFCLKNVAGLKHSPACVVVARKMSTSEKKQKVDESKIIKSVFISQSNDVFTNLALEDWLYRNVDLNNHHILLLWRNSPCVVIGRHQNPWVESNIEYLAANDIEIARRNSGGGAVYHDKGNLNLTFFTPRDLYDRKKNLNMISKALYREWGMNVMISPREDLLLNNHYKVSGTASKLGRPNAYHHCTLLVDSDKKNLRNSLSKNEFSVETNATRSVPSPISNLKDGNFHVSVDKLLTAVGLEYMRTTPVTCQDGGHEMISKQRGFQLINPTDKWFPGLGELREQFLSWNWRFGRTPKFTIKKTLEQPMTELKMDVAKGQIVDVSLSVSAVNMGHVEPEQVNLLEKMNGEKYSQDIFAQLSQSLVQAQTQEDVKKSAASLA